MRTISRAGVMKRRTKNRYTMGACLAAAAAASARMLVTGELIQRIETEISEGLKASFDLLNQVAGEDSAECSIVNDYGYEKDKATEIKLSARAQWVMNDHQNERMHEAAKIPITSSNYGKVILVVGTGIGIVTKPGLCVPVNQYAIHPEVKETIIRKVEAYVPAGKIVNIMISVTVDKSVAGNAMNRRLGIKGGISIFDTGGIIKDSPETGSLNIATAQVDIALAQGIKAIAISLDENGIETAKRFLAFREDAVIFMKENIAGLLDYCVSKGIKEIIVTGCLNKILQIANGAVEFEKEEKKETIEILKGIIREHTKDVAPLFFVMRARSIEEASSGLEKMGQVKLLDIIARRATAKIKNRVDHNMEIGTVAAESTGHIIAADESAREIQRRANKV